MKRTTTPNRTPIARRSHRRDTKSLRCGRLARAGLGALLVALLAMGDPAAAQTGGESPAGTTVQRSLRLADVELNGATRTTLATVYEHLDLQAGQEIAQADLLTAVERLRARGLFREVEFYTRPGVRRGHVILVLEVREHDLDFRWAVGNTDLDGWYSSPAMVSYDNPFGRGGLFDLQWRVGFRHSGLQLRYEQPRIGPHGAYRNARLGLMDTDRPYVADGVEYRHSVGVASVRGAYGLGLGDHDLLELGLGYESIDVDDRATAATASADGSISIDQKIPVEQLPGSIAEAEGRHNRAVLHADWQHDTRSEARRAGSPVDGTWGRLKAHAVLQDRHSHTGLTADVRAYRQAPGGVWVFRLRGQWVGSRAAFHDRPYLGGMYSVRGFATHSLSAPGGDTWAWNGSLEYRSAILTDPRGTKLAGVLFLDAGAAGAADAPDPYRGVAAGVGYGVRLRVPWLDWLGVDVGFPLTDRPLDARFQATASIGWNF